MFYLHFVWDMPFCANFFYFFKKTSISCVSHSFCKNKTTFLYVQSVEHLILPKCQLSPVVFS